jgi:S-adenosylmethionine:tRNA ribosyltransferase-isomerase
MIRESNKNEWEIMSRGRYSGPLKITENLTAHIEGGKYALFPSGINMKDILWELGMMPLPPYIQRKATHDDRIWYQTVYANTEGSIAAPTAGLHFTEHVLKRAEDSGIKVRYITLHVGVGTFKPIKTDTLEEHTMEHEYYEISSSLINEIEENKQHGKRVIAVGTTTTRALEGYMSSGHMTSKRNGCVSGTTEIFIYPGHTFKAISSLLTNFHLPRSTPIMLTSAIAGRENLLNGYREAVNMRYRFFSYGDAMLIL